MAATEHYGLGDPLMLEKIDKLFACGVGDHVDLPQIVVVGDQSSGKSSVLQGLIRMPLPRDSGLCTRFATQIVFRRSAEERVSVSIIADRDASPEHRARLEAWDKSDLTKLDADSFSIIMQEVHELMGLAGDSDLPGQKPTFSRDVLRLEITGPHQEHLSVIDVPGIFKSTTTGMTTKADIALVTRMVQGYMDNPRSVMLTVIPANVDVATQEILEMASDVDPEGDRTLGVLTKPDLVDQGAESRVMDLIQGRARVMKLGWHIVRNPGQQHILDTSLNRESLELDFFRQNSPWNTLPADKRGIESLRGRLQEVLSSLIRREFPKVKQEIGKKLATAQKRLNGLGPERGTSASQIAYLTDMATRFQRLVVLALNAKYGVDELFETHPSLRLAPAVTSRSSAFSHEMDRWGGEYSFRAQSGQTPKLDLKLSATSAPAESEPLGDESPNLGHDGFDVRKEKDIDDLADLLHPSEIIAKSRVLKIQAWLQEVYETSRGFELGTFDSSILATTFKKQTSKWTSLSLGYVSDIIVHVHTFITTALESLCSDSHVRSALFGILTEGLLSRYQKAMDHIRFILTVERDGTPMTTNHYFNDNLEKCRQKRMQAAMSKYAINDCTHGSVVKLENTMLTHHMSNAEHTIQDIHDILESYYKVARKRFVDCVVKQGVDHFLVTGTDTPLTLFAPTFVSALTAHELESIAGEAPRFKRERAQLTKEIVSLEEAKKILHRG